MWDESTAIDFDGTNVGIIDTRSNSHFIHFFVEYFLNTSSNFDLTITFGLRKLAEISDLLEHFLMEFQDILTNIHDYHI